MDYFKSIRFVLFVLFTSSVTSVYAVIPSANDSGINPPGWAGGDPLPPAQYVPQHQVTVFFPNYRRNYSFPKTTTTVGSVVTTLETELEAGIQTRTYLLTKRAITSRPAKLAELSFASFEDQGSLLSEMPDPWLLYVDYVCSSCPLDEKNFVKSRRERCSRCTPMPPVEMQPIARVSTVAPNAISLVESTILTGPAANFDNQKVSYYKKSRMKKQRSGFGLALFAEAYARTLNPDLVTSPSPVIWVGSAQTALVFDRKTQTLSIEEIAVPLLNDPMTFQSFKDATSSEATSSSSTSNDRTLIAVILTDDHGNLWIRKNPNVPSPLEVGTSIVRDSWKWDEIPSELASTDSESFYFSLFSYSKFQSFIDFHFAVLEAFGEQDRVQRAQNMALAYVRFESSILVIQSAGAVKYYSKRRLLLIEKKRVMETVGYNPMTLQSFIGERSQTKPAQ